VITADKLHAAWQLMRADKPIGTYLLLWPTLWALWIAAGGFPSWDLLFIFSLGVWVTRSAGCVINDFADRKVDGHVKRTQTPTPQTNTSKEAMGYYWINADRIYLSVVY